MQPIWAARAARCKRRSRTNLAMLCLLGLIQIGCNSSRYGVRYEQRLPDLKRIAVMPGSIEVSSLHSGGVQESRPDLVGTARDRALDCVLTELIHRQVDTIRLDQPISAPVGNDSNARRVALVHAVANAIRVHHYQIGNQEVFDYSAGDASRVAIGSQDADAVLWVYMTAVVPTEGREALKATAIVVGVLTGIHIRVNTCGAVVTLLLVDARTGDVLWFNQLAAERDIRDGKSVEKLFHEVSRYLMKPRK